MSIFLRKKQHTLPLHKPQVLVGGVVHTISNTKISFIQIHFFLYFFSSCFFFSPSLLFLFLEERIPSEQVLPVYPESHWQYVDVAFATHTPCMQTGVQTKTIY